MIRLLHTADLHLDTPFSGLPAEKACEMRAAQKDIVYAICDRACGFKADIVLISGDVFDGAGAFYDTVRMLRDAVGQLPARVFIVSGNHDCAGSVSPFDAVDWPENVTLFRAPAIERKEACGIGVCGAGFSSRYLEKNVLSGFHAEGPCIGLLHGDVSSVSRYGPVSENDIASSGLIYLGLGHIHTFSGIKRSGETAWCYCGCPSGRGFDETGDKGVVLAEISDNGEVNAYFSPLKVRRYFDLTADITGTLDEDELWKRASAVLDVCEKRDIARLTLTGAPEFAPDAESVAARSELFFTEVRLKLTERPHLWALAGEDTLIGSAMRRLREIYDAAGSDKERAEAEQAAIYLLAAAKNIRTDEMGGVTLW